MILSPQGAVIRINAVAGSPIGRSLWAWIELVSILPHVFLRAYLPLVMGKMVIADRYVVDSVVSTAYSLDDPAFDSRIMARLFLALIPRNSILVFLDSTYEEIRRRRGKLADPQDYIEFQRSMYHRLSKHLDAFGVSTTEQNIEETASMVRNLLVRCKARRTNAPSGTV